MLAAGRKPEAVKLGGAKAIDELISMWRSDVALEALAPGASRASQPSRESGKALKEATWDRVASHVAGAATVFVVTDGALGLVPFAALPAGESAYLLEQAPPIHYLTAERDLVPAPGSPGARGQGLLAVGGATFDRGPSSTATAPLASTPGANATAASEVRAGSLTCGGLLNHRFEPLSATLEEVQDVSRIWWRQPGSSASARVLTGPDATEGAVKKDAR